MQPAPAFFDHRIKMFEELKAEYDASVKGACVYPGRYVFSDQVSDHSQAPRGYYYYYAGRIDKIGQELGNKPYGYREGNLEKSF